MSNSRIEAILTRLANKHAPQLLTTPPAPDVKTQINTLSYGLAKVGTLVLMGDLSEGLRAERETHVNNWVSLVATLYRLLVDALFPSLQRMEATYADSQFPPIIVLDVESEFVARMIAGYIIPYVAARQGETHLSEAELRGVMMMVMDELDADTLPTPSYNKLLSEGIGVLRALIELPIKHITLTEFARPIFQELKTPTPPPPPPPPTVPEPGKIVTKELFTSSIPIFYQKLSSASSDDKPKSHPPVRPPGKRD